MRMDYWDDDYYYPRHRYWRWWRRHHHYDDYDDYDDWDDYPYHRWSW